jgi:hypothetical protein
MRIVSVTSLGRPEELQILDSGPGQMRLRVQVAT